MSSLSPMITSTLDQLRTEIDALRRGGSSQEPKPHKLLLLLAVLDLSEEGRLVENKIYFDERLIALFEKHFRQFANEGDWCQPGPPFFHLRSSSFWHHKIREGREQAYSKLTTSGGGTKRIIENIEYAYLSSDVYEAICNPIVRSELYSFIRLQLDDYSPKGVEMNEAISKRIGTMFHETFSLSRPAIEAILSTLNTEETLTSLHTTLRNQTHLGTNYIKAMPRYARGCGLVSAGNRLTAFGAHVVKFDPLMKSDSTQWLMHYFLSAPHGPGPLFWHEFVRTQFRYGQEFTKSSLAEQLIDFVDTQEAKELKAGSATSTANIFVGTYEKDDALGRLSIIEKVDDRYRVLDPDPPSIWAFAVALLDFWQYQFPHRVTINLDELYTDGGLTSIFMIGEGRLNRYLRSLQQEGIVDVFRVAPPYQVVLLNPDLSFVLDRLYTNDDGE